LATKIGYVAQIFPYLSETFVYREVKTLRAKGLDVQTFSTWQPKLDELSAEARSLVDDTFYIFPLNKVQFVRSHAMFLATRPLPYLRALLFCLSRPHKTWKNRLRTLMHFAQAVYMAQAVEQRGVEHLHVHFALNATTIAMVIYHLTGVTFSFTAHANDLFCNPILLTEKIEESAFIIAISEYNKRFMYNLLPQQKIAEKINIVHCGIDIARYAPTDKGTSDKRPTIVAVGRLVEKKGYPYLIKACRVLVDHGYDFHCLIIGGGPEEAALRQLVTEHDLTEYITLTGVVFQEEMRNYLSRADLTVLPCVVAQNQDMDGIPNTLMEAMAMEIPAISTQVSGIPELIEDGKTGLLVPPEDEVALAEAIARLLNDEPLRTKLGQAGRVKVTTEFEINKNTDQLLDIFRTQIQPKSSTLLARQKHTQRLTFFSLFLLISGLLLWLGYRGRSNRT